MIMNYLLDLLSQYGYIILGSSLLLELVALPIPGEPLMMYCGFLVYSQRLNWGLSILVAASGAITGITISYFIGRILEIKFFEKYGKYVHLAPKRLDEIADWFEKYGKVLLVISFYIPGVRHLTGYFCGITRIKFKEYALYSYSGAVIWAALFISLGEIFGSKWEQYHKIMSQYFIIIGLVIAAAAVIIYGYYKYKVKILGFFLNLFKKSVKTYHSLGRVKIAVVAIAVVFFQKHLHRFFKG